MLEAIKKQSPYDVDPALTVEACLLIREEVRRLRSFRAPPADLLTRWEELSLRAREAEKRDFPQQIIADRYRLDRKFSGGVMPAFDRFWDTQIERYVSGRCMRLSAAEDYIDRYMLEVLMQIGEETEHI